LRIAVDIGGTFTDVVLEEDGKRLTRKLLTTPQRPEEAVLDGVRLILADAGRGFGDRLQIVRHVGEVAVDPDPGPHPE